MRAALMTDPAPEAAASAFGFGQPSRGLTIRSSDNPPFSMARAVNPIFSPSCGSTRITDGPPVTELPDPFTSERGWVGENPIFDFLRKMYRNDLFAARTALAIEEELRPDLMLVYLPGIDRISHILWYSVEPVESIQGCLVSNVTK